LKPASIPTAQIPISMVVLVVAMLAFLIRGGIELNCLLRWMDNRGTMQSCHAAILRAESSGRFEDARIMRIVASRYAQREARDRPGASGVLSLIGCAIGMLVASVAAGWCWGKFLIAAVLRRAGREAGAKVRESQRERC
jgi:hypothetical protein